MWYKRERKEKFSGSFPAAVLKEVTLYYWTFLLESYEGMRIGRSWGSIHARLLKEEEHCNKRVTRSTRNYSNFLFDSHAFLHYSAALHTTTANSHG